MKRRDSSPFDPFASRSSQVQGVGKERGQGGSERARRVEAPSQILIPLPAGVSELQRACHAPFLFTRGSEGCNADGSIEQQASKARQGPYHALYASSI